MRCAILCLLFLATIPSLFAGDTASERTDDYTKEQLLDAKESRERWLGKLRDEVALRQNLLNRSRAAVDSEQRNELKAAVAEKKAEFSAALKQPTSHWIEQAQIDKALAEEDAIKAVKEAAIAREMMQQEAKLKAEKIAQKGPIKVVAAGFRPNTIGIPALTMKVKNQASQSVIAYTIAAECTDRFDRPAVEIKQDNVYRGISQTTIAAGSTEVGTWNLNLHRNATKLKVWITRAKMADGTEWSQSDADALANDNFVTIEMD
jgi:dsDNA-binding SOS-regulon protein